ncbi:MAG: ISAzo13 family transposase, partial [Proteobacteria bacterium]|nr:ISAzo13 family transposase [Pseudomonadota bacterium]
MQIMLSETLKKTYQEAAKHLKGSARRKFMAGIVADMGRGGLFYCARELGWDFKTMQKGRQELESGIDFRDVGENQGR